jgi:hypothetical protein
MLSSEYISDLQQHPRTGLYRTELDYPRPVYSRPGPGVLEDAANPFRYLQYSLRNLYWRKRRLLRAAVERVRQCSQHPVRRFAAPWKRSLGEAPLI